MVVMRLTPRQRDVLELVQRGLTNRQIARDLGLQFDTVRSNVKALHEIFGTEGDRARLAAVEFERLG